MSCKLIDGIKMSIFYFTIYCTAISNLENPILFLKTVQWEALSPIAISTTESV